MLIEWMDEREQAQNLDANAQPDEETRKPQELIRRVMEQVLADEGVQMETVVGVTLVDPDRIREINNAFRKVDRVTDVLSFPMIGGMLKDATPAELLGCVDPETGALELGDLVICVDRAKEQAAEYGHSVRRELGYLSAHGLLHLCGYDHETDEERAQMREREEAKRKELVKVISDATGARAEYKFMPTCNYEIDYFTITKDGTLLFDDSADSEEVEQVLEAITAAGFECEAQDGEEQLSEEESEVADTEPQSETVGLTVEIPLDKAAVGNLTKLLDAKGSLIKKALGVSDLPIEIQEDRVAFPWFSELPDADAVKAYSHFISALCEMSKNAKRVTVTEKAVDNEKYAFRCFLLRLGFIGSEYKAERKILLKNLSGSSAFKNGGADHAVSE